MRNKAIGLIILHVIVIAIVAGLGLDDSVTLGLSLIFMILYFIVSRKYAKEKGKSSLLWGILGVVFGPIALIVLLLSSSVAQANVSMADNSKLGIKSTQQSKSKVDWDEVKSTVEDIIDDVKNSETTEGLEDAETDGNVGEDVEQNVEAEAETEEEDDDDDDEW